ncbi:MAG: extracellular solute-binding protein [Anaerolineae bacterium]
MKKLALVLVLALLFGALGTHVSRAQTEIRITWYSDGNEGEVIKEQLAKYMEATPDVKVVLDEVDYANGIQKTLPVQLEAGEGPDIARVTNLGGLAQYYLDLTPYLSDTKYWLDNMDPFLGALRLPGDTTTIPGYMTQLTVTGPFINKTLFDQAGVAVPADGATWEEWAAAAKEVAEKTGTPFAMAMDRSGHRLAGPAVSMGAKYFDADGKPSLVGDEGFKKMAELMVQWHKDGLMPPEVWIGNAGTYAAANEPFVNAQIAFYMSGSWQISQFATNIGDPSTGKPYPILVVRLPARECPVVRRW